MDTVQQKLTGTVEKMSSAQTIRVAFKVTKVHPLYRKRYTLTKHIVAHNPDLKLAIGDTVTITPCRPISKTKAWIVIPS